jgi:type I restriction enzyme, R subunit
MDYQQKYEEIVVDYNREKDRATIEDTFRRLVELVNSLNEEQRRAAKEGLHEDELALSDRKDGLDKSSRERVKQASRDLLASIKTRLAELDRFWEKSRPRLMSKSSFWIRFSPAFPRRPFTD